MGEKMRDATLNYLRTTSTYTSLVSGELATHFGLRGSDRKQRIDEIILAVVNGMDIEFVPIRYTRGKFTNGIKFKVLAKNLSDVINLPEGDVVTEKDQVLPWLRWLLTFGDKIIISEYEIKLEQGKGRSRGGYMISEKAGVWRVPPEYSGTRHDNWLTRALNNNSTAYFSIIERVIKDELQRI